MVQLHRLRAYSGREGSIGVSEVFDIPDAAQDGRQHREREPQAQRGDHPNTASATAPTSMSKRLRMKREKPIM